MTLSRNATKAREELRAEKGGKQHENHLFELQTPLRIVNPSDTCEYAEPKERGSEELRKKQMTTKNAIKILKRLYPALSSAGKEAIGEAVEALEKQIPKKPDRGQNIFDKENEVLCPVCGNPNPNTYCGTCGQRIDWSDIT